MSAATITGRTTKSAVILTAVDATGATLAKGRTKSIGYTFLVARYYSGVRQSTGERLAKPAIRVLKRTGDVKVARREAERVPGSVVLQLHAGGEYRPYGT